VVCKIPNEGLTDDAELIEVVPQLVSRYLGTMPPYMSLRELVNNARAIT
jgi:hypothetical protein